MLFVLTKPSLHLSLHFDGIRLHRDRVAEFEGGVEAFAKACSVHIAKETGFQVEIVEKRHYVLVDLIESEATLEDAAVPELGTVLLETGNCIALALWRAGSAADKLNVLAAVSQASGVNSAARSTGGRSYRECLLEYKASATAHVGFKPARTGKYLLHAEGHGRPRCVMVACNLDDGSCVCYHGKKSLSLTLERLK